MQLFMKSQRVPALHLRPVLESAPFGSTKQYGFPASPHAMQLFMKSQRVPALHLRPVLESLPFGSTKQYGFPASPHAMQLFMKSQRAPGSHDLSAAQRTCLSPPHVGSGSTHDGGGSGVVV